MPAMSVGMYLSGKYASSNDVHAIVAAGKYASSNVVSSYARMYFSSKYASSCQQQVC